METQALGRMALHEGASLSGAEASGEWRSEGSPKPAAIRRSPPLLTQLRERRVVEWMATYLVGCWVVLQTMDVLGELWGWPLLAQQVVSLSLGLGVLPVFAAAWSAGARETGRITSAQATLLAATLMSLVITVWCVCFNRVMS